MHTQTDYPKHIYDPFRREIAVRYIRHEIRKLFSDLQDPEAWKIIDFNISKWFKDDPLFIPVRDFWNGVHAISMGFRLKNIVSWLTSINMKWQEFDILVDELWFGTTFPDLKPAGEFPSAIKVREWFYKPENTDILLKAQEDEEERGNQTMPRNEFPIFVVRKEENKLRVIDGNRRLKRAILLGHQTIKAVVGEPLAEPSIFEAWIPTQILTELVSFHRYWTSLNRDMTESVAEVIAELIRDSSCGRLEFVHRSLSELADPDKKLLESVRNSLKRKDIDL